MKTYISKLKAGQNGWVIKDNKIQELVIGSVKISSIEFRREIVTRVEYGIREFEGGNFKEWVYYPEDKIFESKEELIKSL